MPEPLKVRLAAGRHALCACGQTRNAPLCDGSHAGSDTTPELVNLDDETLVAWCTCRQSGNLPHCDGSHRNC